MSAHFGEIGYKIGARGNQSPLVNLIVAASGQQQPQNGTLGKGAAALTVVGMVGTTAALVVLNTGASGFLANGIFVKAGIGVTDRPLLVTGGLNGTSTFLSMDGNGNAQIGFTTQSVPAFNITNGGVCAVAGQLQVWNNGSSIEYGLWGPAGLEIRNVNSGGGGWILKVNESAVANANLFSCGGNGVPATVCGTATPYAWGTGTHYPILQMAGIGALFGTDTMGVVLTGGGLYYNGTNYIYGQAGTGAIMSLGTGSFTVSIVSTSGVAGGTATLTTVFAIGGTVTSNKIQGYGPTAAGLVDMTPDKGTFTATLQGVSNVATAICAWARSGNVVTLTINSPSNNALGTSNATTFTLAPLPAAIVPAGNVAWRAPFLSDNGVATVGQAGIFGTSTVTFYKASDINGNTWTASGQKGFNGPLTFSYNLN